LKEEKRKEVQIVDRRTWKSEKRKKRKHSERERENPSADSKGQTTKPKESASLWMIVLDTWTEFVLEERRKLG
jgi:hypothetical protein